MTLALNVSRGSVREALLILERRHLVAILPRRGAHVTVLDERSVRYAALLPVVVKLVVAYRLYLGQTACHELWEHYGGQSRNGMIPLVLMTQLLPALWNSTALHPLLLQVLR